MPLEGQTSVLHRAVVFAEVKMCKGCLVWSRGQINTEPSQPLKQRCLPGQGYPCYPLSGGKFLTWGKPNSFEASVLRWPVL